MDISKISAGNNPPEDINVIIEVPMYDTPIKYEIDKESGALFVDRFLHTPMCYPCNYGFMPHTLSGDGDPVDVLVVAQHKIAHGAVIRCRPVGVLVMEDEAGEDEKVLAVPVSKMHPAFDHIKNYSDLPANLCDEISHFFAHYKDLEKNKTVTLKGWEDVNTAKRLIVEGLERAGTKKAA